MPSLILWLIIYMHLGGQSSKSVKLCMLLNRDSYNQIGSELSLAVYTEGKCLARFFIR